MNLTRLFISVMLLISNVGITQSFEMPKTELLNFLYHTNDSITIITNQDPNVAVIKLNEVRINKHIQKIIKNKNGLFVTVDQTGRLYKLNNESKNKIIFTRIDSTYYWGYNGGSIDFSYNDTIFSFGGGGFWRINGQLRYYSDAFHEWNIKPLFEENPTFNYLYFLNRTCKNLYYVQHPIEDIVTNKILYSWEVYNLNLQSGKILKLGSISKDLLEMLKTHNINFINLSYSNGILLNINYKKILFLDFEKNEVFNLENNQFLKDLITGSSTQIYMQNTFQIRDSIFYTLSNDSTLKLHSFHFDLKYFVKEPYRIYDTIIEENNDLWYIVSAIVCSGIGLIGYLKNKRKKTIRNNAEFEILKENFENINEFNQIEVNLIEHIIFHCSNGKYISTDLINSILGVSKKSIETQKKVKGDTINRINYKFKTLFERDIEFIERIRSENDRRFYNYIINKENAALYKSKFKIKS